MEEITKVLQRVWEKPFEYFVSKYYTIGTMSYNYSKTIKQEEKMKQKILTLLLLFGVFFTNLQADKLQLPKCDNKSTCVNDKNFYVEVKRVVRRGDIIIVQLAFIGKANFYNFYFSTIGFEGHAVILDANGNEFKISGGKISNFSLEAGAKKIISLKFKSDKQKKITEPFDLTLKTEHDEITLFDLKSN